MPGHRNRGRGKDRGRGMTRHKRFNKAGGAFSLPSQYDFQTRKSPSNSMSCETSEDTDELTMLKKKAKQIRDQLDLLKGHAPAKTDKGNARQALVDQDLCTGCGRCIRVCPTAALSLLDGTAAVNVEKCTGCGLCVQECPLGAISLKSES